MSTDFFFKFNRWFYHDNFFDLMKFSSFKIFIFVVKFFIVVNSSTEEAQLYENLLKDYNVYERPVADSHQNVTVNVGLALQQIVDVVKFCCFVMI